MMLSVLLASGMKIISCFWVSGVLVGLKQLCLHQFYPVIACT